MLFPVLLFVCVGSQLPERFPRFFHGPGFGRPFLYIDFGKKSMDCIQCHTDVNTCCSSSQGPHRGDWYFPNGSRLPFEGQGDIFERRADQRVNLCRRVGSFPPQPGIYHCDIPISSGEQLSVHVGVYGGNDGGNKIIEH